MLAAMLICMAAMAQSVDIGNLRYTVLAGTQNCKVEAADHKSDFTTTEVAIPSQVTIDGNKYTVTELAEGAFLLKASLVKYKTCYIKRITLPSTLTTIGNNAMKKCAYLQRIDIPDAVTSIGVDAFTSCTALDTVVIGSGVEYLKGFCFDSDDQIGRVEVRATTPPSLGESCFTSSVTSGATLVVPKGCKDAYKATGWNDFTNMVESDGGGADPGDNPNPNPDQPSVTIGKLLYTALDNTTCKVELANHDTEFLEGDFNIPAQVEIEGKTYSVAEIPENGFQATYNLMSSLTLPETLRRIGKKAFNHTSDLKTLVIPNSVTEMGEEAFGDNAISQLTIGSGLSSLPDYAFFNTSSDMEVEMLAQEPPTIESNTFNVSKCTKLTVPYGSKSKYQSADIWKNFPNIVEAGQPVEPRLFGDSLLIYIDALQTWQGQSFQSFHGIPINDDGRSSQVGETIGHTALWGAPYEDFYYLLNRVDTENGYEYQLNVLDRASLSKVSTITASSDWVSYDTEADPTSGRIYGVFADGASNYVWGYFDPQQKKRVKIADFDMMADDGVTRAYVAALAISPEGKGYAFMTTGKLYTVDIKTGAFTYAAPLTVNGKEAPFTNVQSATWDTADNKLLVSYTSDRDGAYIYAVDTTTGEMTKLYETKGTVTVMYNVSATTSPKAPGLPQSLKLGFSNGSLTGDISFTAPTKSNNGSDLTGSLTYNIVSRGLVVGQGTALPGAETKTTVTAAEDSKVVYSVYYSNESGKGLAKSASAFAGMDLPAAPAPHAAFDEAKKSITISWDAVTTGANGGYVDAKKVGYTIIRYPQMRVMGTTTQTSFTDNTLEMPEDGSTRGYYYKVIATLGQLEGGSAESNKIMLGHLYPTWRETFDTAESMDNFTIIDKGGDGNTWEYNPTYKCCGAYDNLYFEPKDDWLISPPLYLRKGLTYKLSFNTTSRRNYEERFTLCMGRGNEEKDMTTLLMDTTRVATKNLSKPTDYWDNHQDITVDEDGVYYIGWHAVSEPHKLWLILDNIELLEGVVPGAPAAVANLDVKADGQGRLKADISFEMPKLNSDSTAINGKLKALILRDDSTIATLDNLEPGQAVAYTDPVGAPKDYTYCVVALNGEKRGVENSMRVFVGNSIPRKATDVAASEDKDKLGQVTISWKAPATDTNGREILPDNLTYDVYYSSDTGEQGTVATGVAGTSVTYTACEPDADPHFYVFSVYARTAAGRSEVWSQSKQTSLGRAYAAPYYESFSGSNGLTAPLGIDIITGNKQTSGWGGYYDDTELGVYSQDSDRVFAAYVGNAVGDCAELVTSKISLAPLSDPVLTFWVDNFNTEGNSDKNTLEVQIGSFGNWTPYDVFTIGSLDPGWNKVEVDLDEYRGRMVQVLWKATVQNYAVLAIDNISIDNRGVAASVPTVGGEADVAGESYYSIDGRQMSRPQKGITIHRIQMKNGSVKIVKSLMR